MSVHKDILINFKIDGSRFEAVGFLNNGESSVDGETMLSRTAGENGGAIGYEDATFLRQRFLKFPKKLRKHCLVTNQRFPDKQDQISCFVWSDEGGWFLYRSNINLPWIDSNLVLRRYP